MCVASCMLTLAGCDLAPPYHPPTVVIPPAFKEGVVAKPGKHPQAGPWRPAQPADAVPRGPWWQVYRNPELNQLESQVDIGNQTLAGTLAVYNQARAFAQEAEAGLYPDRRRGRCDNDQQTIRQPAATIRATSPTTTAPTQSMRRRITKSTSGAGSATPLPRERRRHRPATRISRASG